MSAEADIAQLHAGWRAAFARRDADAALALLASDYQLWPQHQPPITVEQLRPRFTAAFAAYLIEPAFECEETLLSGDLAVQRGWDVQRIRPHSGGPEQVLRQYVFLVLRREGDGWRFARGVALPATPAA